MAQFQTLTARYVMLPVDDVDTDQIIPARFLKVTDKAGLGQSLFADWRGPTFVLDQPDAPGARILVAGQNFGCGSSREHAPWALVGWGFRAVVARSFADIFRNNALKNGLLPVEVDAAMHEAITQARTKNPAVELHIDLATRRVTLPGGPSAEFPVDAFAQKCLLEGLDELSYLLKQDGRIGAYEARNV
jgi:3-isopropylmalate/(R)-2-methylmalate dehydratase small subunit